VRRNADELPETSELLTVQPKDELSDLHSFDHLADWLPRTSVPHNHSASAVLLWGNRAFETRVVDGMVLDMHGICFLLGS
jgi:hypothetical protein